MRLRTDLLDLLEAVVGERVSEFEGKIAWDPRPAVCVVLAAKCYPGNYERGLRITGLAEAGKLPDVKVFHAGTRLDGDLVRTDGGRVLGVTAIGETLPEAQRRAYDAIGRPSFPGMFHRRDLRNQALAPAT